MLKEAFRVLKPGGRLAVSDVVRTAEMPADVLTDLAAHCGCISGAITPEELTALLVAAGFVDVSIKPMVRASVSHCTVPLLRRSASAVIIVPASCLALGASFSGACTRVAT